ncbi:MAG: OmpH family outer membrane protein [Gemmatimonadales bacterium]
MRVPTLVLLAALAAVTPAAAQQRPAAKPATPPPSGAVLRLGYINSRTILQATPGYAQAESTFTREYDDARAEVAKLQSQLDSAAQDFQTSSVLLSPTARQQKQQSLEAQQGQVEQKTQELQTRMQARERELIGPIQSRVQTIIEGLRAEGNYAMIFDVSAMAGALVTADRALDLTQTVISRMQAAK